MEIEDYEQKYLKYKAKYQELKNSVKNKTISMVGGNRNTPPDNSLKKNPEGIVGGNRNTPQENTFKYSSSVSESSNSDDV
jgi:hypothetical protein